MVNRLPQIIQLELKSQSDSKLRPFPHTSLQGILPETQTEIWGQNKIGALHVYSQALV